MRALQQQSVQSGAGVLGVTDAFCAARRAWKRACSRMHGSDENVAANAQPAKRQAAKGGGGGGAGRGAAARGKLTAIRVRSALTARCARSWSTPSSG